MAKVVIDGQLIDTEMITRIGEVHNAFYFKDTEEYDDEIVHLVKFIIYLIGSKKLIKRAATAAGIMACNQMREALIKEWQDSPCKFKDLTVK